MESLNNVLELWKKDSVVDRTEPGRELINIPILHSKYLDILTKSRMLARKYEHELNKTRKIKWEYYTGKLSDIDLKRYGWEPFPFTLKSEIDTYFNSDTDLIDIKNKKSEYDEIVDVCERILKELNSRTFQIRGFIEYEKFIHGN
jgi:hypothetical protein